MVSKMQVDSLIEIASHSEILLRAKTWEVEPLALLELVEGISVNSKISELMDVPTFYAIYVKLGYDGRAAKAQCEKIADFVKNAIPDLSEVRETIRAALDGAEIVYLPTYRRIELSIPSSDARTGRRKSILSRLGVARSGLYTADIQFGLGDISDKLKAIYSEMLYLANQGYGKVSANVINDLITGAYKASGGPKTPPSKESLEIFFARIKDAEREYKRIPYTNFMSTPDLDRVYNDDVSDEARPFLTYFLDQLNSVIQETSDKEELVASFINSCNKYLSGDDDSTDLYLDESQYYDRKQLTFNRSNLRVTVNSSVTGQEVPMESLSSGEKQMISLFARLYLYPGPKIVLIDEPELSLSLDWQRQILPDVLTAPMCKQVIAITHSPFIFDNELEPFAGSLALRINRNVAQVNFQESIFDDDMEVGPDE